MLNYGVALASEGVTDLVTTSPLEKIMGVIPELFELANKCFEAIVDNEMLLIFLGVGFIAIGFRIFRMGKKTAKG